MIQFNLLPSVKLEYVRARRNKRLTIIVASLFGAVSLAVLVILFFSVQIIQKKYSRDLSKDIKTESQKLQGISELNKVLTVQNQLNTLPALHDDKPVTSRLYGYLKQFTPEKVSIASLNVSFDEQTMTITGSAESLSLVNKFIDTLKFTTYDTDDKKGSSAFSEVVLGSFGRDTQGANYQIAMKFDPVIFARNGNPVLVIPAGKITTRSQTEKPTDLFVPLIPSGDKKE